ncbi:type VI secretion system baseplate subunit TssG [Acinetobacter larvae]|uniref:Type VI secretion protein n=1 Tax=Acinetobacter larvae TaxID=1789224 RepID=A0A1B2M0W7_9GAMM|nr:type VI secretion system baseplate subunit TssG [Acinetobacter larvae]AOA58837.1 type VI secretion protein [Acinetobacter larvae]
MRTERWWQEASVIDQLFKVPTAFEFIQVTRLLRHVPYQQHSKYWANDFYFESSLNLNFPTAEIESLTRVDEKVAVRNLLVGLTGIQGALPYNYTNKIKQSARKQRESVQKFMGLFNHKLTAQYVDASLAYNLPIRYEIEAENHYLNILHALNGYISSQHQQVELDDYFAEFAGLMQGQNNTAHALQTMLRCILKQQVKIKEFVEEKFKLADDQKTRLGQGGACLLGLNTFCGDSIRQIDGKIEIQVGPLSYQEYLEYLPQQKQSEKIKSIIQSWCIPTLFIDLRIILAKEAVLAVQLNNQAAAGLGRGTFLMPQDPTENAETCYPLIGAA